MKEMDEGELGCSVVLCNVIIFTLQECGVKLSIVWGSYLYDAAAPWMISRQNRKIIYAITVKIVHKGNIEKSFT